MPSLFALQPAISSSHLYDSSAGCTRRSSFQPECVVVSVSVCILVSQNVLHVVNSRGHLSAGLSLGICSAANSFCGLLRDEELEAVRRLWFISSYLVGFWQNSTQIPYSYSGGSKHKQPRDSFASMAEAVQGRVTISAEQLGLQPG